MSFWKADVLKSTDLDASSMDSAVWRSFKKLPRKKSPPALLRISNTIEADPAEGQLCDVHLCRSLSRVTSMLAA